MIFSNGHCLDCAKEIPAGCYCGKCAKQHIAEHRMRKNGLLLEASLDCENTRSCGKWIKHKLVRRNVVNVVRQRPKADLEADPVPTSYEIEDIYVCVHCGKEKRFGSFSISPPLVEQYLAETNPSADQTD